MFRFEQQNLRKGAPNPRPRRGTSLSMNMLSHKSRYTVATLFLLALFLLSIFYLFFFFTRTTLRPTLSHHTDLYLQLQPSPLPSPPPPPQQPPPSSTATAQPQQPHHPTAADDHESVTNTDTDTDTDTVDDNAGAGAPLKLKECDLYTGTWVEDDNYPIYQPGSCPYVDEAYDCQINGRNDTHYTKWRWKPHACDLPRFPPPLLSLIS